jgi:hypothetical protein
MRADGGPSAMQISEKFAFGPGGLHRYAVILTSFIAKQNYFCRKMTDFKKILKLFDVFTTLCPFRAS